MFDHTPVTDSLEVLGDPGRPISVRQNAYLHSFPFRSIKMAVCHIAEATRQAATCLTVIPTGVSAQSHQPPKKSIQ